MRRLALIPARGGSKRVPRKNIIDFDGRPMIASTIESALETGLFNAVLVSTEDAEIAAIAQQYGAEIQNRPPALATDQARVLDVCLDLLTSEVDQGRPVDLLTVLYATAPLRNSHDIASVTQMVEPNGCHYAMAVTEYSLPPHQAMKQDANGLLTPMWPELVNQRADQIGELLADNGSTYAVWAQAFLKDKTFYGAGLKGHVMPRSRSTDIDTFDDLELAYYYGRSQA